MEKFLKVSTQINFDSVVKNKHTRLKEIKFSKQVATLPLTYQKEQI